MMQERTSIGYLLWLLPAIVAFAVSFNVVSNGFVWDDPIVLEDQLIAFKSVGDVFIPPPGIPHFGMHYYRPLIISSFLLDRKLSGGTPFGYHLSILIVHLLNTVCVYFLSLLLFRNYPHAWLGALASSLFFAVHPVHSESVSWIAGRSDVIAALFFFLSFLLFLKYLNREGAQKFDVRNWSILCLSSAFCFFLAVLAKETSLSLLLLLPIVPIAVGHEGDDRAGNDGKKGFRFQRLIGKMGIASILPFLIATIVYFVLRYHAIRDSGRSIFTMQDPLALFHRTMNAYGYYLSKLFFPVGLKAYIPEVPLGIPFTLFSFIALFALIVSASYALKRGNGILFFLIAFFFFTLIPSVGVAIMNVSETPLAERYLYIPSFSFSLIAGCLALSIPFEKRTSSRGKKILSIFLIVLLSAVALIFSFQTVMRNRVWKDDLFFWEDIVRKVPDYGLPHLNLGVAYRERNRIDDAEREYRKAADAKNYNDDGRATAYNNLGNIYWRKGEYQKAEEYIRIAMSIRPNYANPYYSMALIRWSRFRQQQKSGEMVDDSLPQKAIEDLKVALRINPQYVIAHALIGQIYFRSGKYREAREHLQIVLQYEQEGAAASAAREMLSRIPLE